MLTSPISFREADRLIESREPAATAKTHRQIVASWSDDMKARSFFAARCTNAAILAQLKTLAERIVAGKMTQKQAVRLAREMFAAGADALAAMGFAPKEDARGLAELASISRLNLIFYTQTRMAQEKGHYEQWERVKDKFPYAVWHCGYAREHRAEHLARDGKVYAFDHPIWTQSPPGGEFNCHCWREPITEKQLHERGLAPEAADVAFKPSSLGFDPSKPLDAHNGIRPGKNIPPELRPVPPPPVAPPPHGETPVAPGSPAIPNLPRTNLLEVGVEMPQELQPDIQKPDIQQLPRRGKNNYPIDAIAQEQTAKDARRYKLKLLPEKPQITSAEEVNPNYNTERDEFRKNCQRCVITAEARLRGLDVVAMPSLGRADKLARTFDRRFGWPTVFKNTTSDDLVYCGGDTPEDIVKNIATSMAQCGEGARGIVSVYFYVNGKITGHVFNVQVLNGNVRFFDAQSPLNNVAACFANCLHSLDGDLAKLNPAYLRTDNRKFTAKILRCFKNKE